MIEGTESRIAPDQEKPRTTEQSQVDFVLSPEVEAMVMKKVCNVNEKGNGITAIMGFRADSEENLKKLNDILEMGLLGNAEHKIKDANNRKAAWVKAARGGQAKIWMNIVGAGGDIQFVSDAFYFSCDGTELGFLLDLKSYKHKLTAIKDESCGTSRSYRASPGGGLGMIERKAVAAGFNPEGTWEELKAFLIANREKLEVTDETLKYFGQYYIADSENGFVASPRIAPRNFKGLVFRPTRGIIRGSYTGRVIKETDKTVADKKLRQIVQQILSTYSQKPELIMPIYDIDGNLLWPNQMSYAEVLKLIEKREESEVQ